MVISPSNVARKIGFAAALLAGILTMFATLFAVTGQAPAALVLFPPDKMPEDIRVLSWERNTAVVLSENRDYVRRLYGAGALLVLPFRKNGCLALRPTTSK